MPMSLPLPLPRLLLVVGLVKTGGSGGEERLVAMAEDGRDGG